MVAVSPEVVDFLGYESFEELKENISDIADLFINKPGYIYNFRNFSWIDYIILNHLKSPKVIIKTLTNDIETELSITELIPFDEQSKLFCVSFKNLTPINFDGVPTTENLPDFEEFNQPDKKESFKNDAIPLESFITEQSDIKNDFENEILSIEPSVSEQPDEDVKISIKEDEPLTINFDEISIDEPLIIEEEIKKPEIVGLTLEEKLYDIKSVAEELGLDEPLIRELLVEFIAQAYELKPQIEEALKNEDFTLVHNLIHKIKGAAANLRVEKANEILSNTLDENDPKILKEILDQLYDFIEKFNSELMLSVSKPQEAVEKEKIEEIGLEEEPEKCEPIDFEKTEPYEELEQREVEYSFENDINLTNSFIKEETEVEPKTTLKEEPLSINFDEISLQEPLTTEETEMKEEIKTKPAEITLEEKLYDIKSVAEELGLDESLIRDLLVEFIAQAYELKPQIEEALKNEDFTLVHNLIHKIKGAVANLRVEKANEILSNTSNENDPKILKEILDQLYDFIEKFNSELMLSVSKPQEAVEKEKIEEIVLEEEPEKNIEKIKTEIIYDPSIASEELGISKDIVLEFVKEFIEQSLNLKNVFDSYLKNSDIESIKNLSHKLKGTATNLRIEKADNILSKILKSKDLDKIRDLIDEFNRTIEEIASNLGFAGKTNEPSKEVGSKILNVEEILDHGAHTIGLDIETYKEFIAEYLKEIENLFTLEDIENIKKEAQKLKSIAENLRLDPITEKLETVLESSDNEQITVIISDIKEILKNLKNI